MNQFIRIIKSLRKSTLEDIGKKIGGVEGDLDKEELVKRIEDTVSQKKITDSLVFQIGYPVLLLFIGFFIGKVTDISNSELRNTYKRNDSLTQKKISRLYKPLPNKLKIKDLDIQIDTIEFENFLPMIRNKYSNLKSGLIKSYSDYNKKVLLRSGFNLVDNNLIDLFENKYLNIRISIGDSLFERDEKLQKPYVSWKYKSKLSFKGNNQVYYWVDHLNNGAEYIELDYNYVENDNNVENNSLSYMNGAESAIDLCDKIVKVYIDIVDKHGKAIVSPQLSFKTFTLADNNGRDYEIIFLRNSNYYDVDLLRAVQKNGYPNYRESNLQWYMIGFFSCESF